MEQIINVNAHYNPEEIKVTVLDDGVTVVKVGTLKLFFTSLDEAKQFGMTVQWECEDLNWEAKK